MLIIDNILIILWIYFSFSALLYAVFIIWKIRKRLMASEEATRPVTVIRLEYAILKSLRTLHSIQ